MKLEPAAGLKPLSHQLLGLDSSFGARKELASSKSSASIVKMADSAQVNVWLHKTVLQKLAENGGNVPKELLDQF